MPLVWEKHQRVMPGLWQSGRVGCCGRSPPHRQTSCPCPSPCQATGRSLPARTGGCRFRRAGRVCPWFGNAAKVQPSQMNMCMRAVPCYGAYVEEDLAVKAVPWVWEPVPGSALGNQVNNKIPDASASLAAPPSVKQRVFPPLSCTYPVVDLLGLGAPWSRTSTWEPACPVP